MWQSLSLENRETRRVRIGPCSHHSFHLGQPSPGGGWPRNCFFWYPAERDHTEPIHLHHHPGDQHLFVAPGHQLRIHEHPCTFCQPTHHYCFSWCHCRHHQVHKQCECSGWIGEGQPWIFPGIKGDREVVESLSNLPILLAWSLLGMWWAGLPALCSLVGTLSI